MSSSPTGPLRLVTPPSGLAVSLDDARLHCRIDGTDEDPLVEGLVRAAADLVEREIPGTRQLLTAVWDVPLCGWPCGELRLPRPPLQSLTVSYYDAADALQALSSSVYRVTTATNQPGTLALAAGQSWPVLSPWREWPVCVRMTCGYGAAAAVPPALRQAILLLVGQWYARREAQSERTLGDVGFGVRALLDSCGWGSYA